MDTDVIVIGAGLAGLQCARRAEANGHSVIVLESEDAVGGRVRTDRFDGFLCDRGFQLLNPAYPAVRNSIDLRALQLQKFGVGVVVRRGETTNTLAHPIKHPRHAWATVTSDITPMADLIALARWMGPILLRPSMAYRASSDVTLTMALDAARLTGRLRRDVLDTFLAGVLADSTGETSANYVRLLLRFFALGTPGLPRAGMQALPEQMAASLVEPVRLHTVARELRETSDGVHVATDNGTIHGRVAVVAVAPQDLPRLTELSAPETRGLTTWWFRSPERPREGTFLMLDASRPGGGPSGPIWHTAVVSEAAPSYAPAGQHLIQATTLLDRPDGLAEESAVRRDLERLYQTSTRSWELLVHHIVPHALPTQPPPLVDCEPQWTGNRVLVTGDHRVMGSIQGAIVSGDRAAREVEKLLAS